MVIKAIRAVILEESKKNMKDIYDQVQRIKKRKGVLTDRVKRARDNSETARGMGGLSADSKRKKVADPNIVRALGRGDRINVSRIGK